MITTGAMKNITFISRKKIFYAFSLFLSLCRLMFFFFKYTLFYLPYISWRTIVKIQTLYIWIGICSKTFSLYKKQLVLRITETLLKLWKTLIKKKRLKNYLISINNTSYEKLFNVFNFCVLNFESRKDFFPRI